jgi:hypothetical protein
MRCGRRPAGLRVYRWRSYHADPADIVALLCIRPAKSGGLSTVVRSAAVYDELARTRPDLTQVLYQPWWRDLRTGDGPDSFCQSPVYARDDHGRLSVSYGPDYIRSAQRGAHVPPLSSAQLEAMAVLDQLNSDPRFSVTMDLRPGDVQFLNNHVVLHRRTAYEDYPEPERRRDLIRLWLNVGTTQTGHSPKRERPFPRLHAGTGAERPVGLRQLPHLVGGVRAGPDLQLGAGAPVAGIV